MTRIIIESDNSKDVSLIKELADRLKIKYKILKAPDLSERVKKKPEIWEVINRGIDVSNYGDPSSWQKEVRKSRSINFSK